jgi:phosphoribosylanthranilate isomerase
MVDRQYPQIKICGLTNPSEALACAELGADAIGLVFYPKSPRNVSVEQALAITAALPERVAKVGVFVDPDLDTLNNIVKQCGLSCVQFHGKESPEFITTFKKGSDALIVKGLFTEKRPSFENADDYKVDGYLVECGKGRLPGGNAMAWNWACAKEFAHNHPLVLAGGLAPDNVAKAIADCMPDAVDASSSLEAAPGRKDLNKVRPFIEQIRQTAPLYTSRKRKIRPILIYPTLSGGNYAGENNHRHPKRGHST